MLWRNSNSANIMTDDELAGIHQADDRGVVGPSILAIGLIVSGITVWMINDQRDNSAPRAPITVISQNG